MAAGDRHLQGALDLLLADDVGEVQIGGVGAAQQRVHVGRRGGFAAAGLQLRHGLRQVGDGVDLQTLDE